jgi:hypothetical protein
MVSDEISVPVGFAAIVATFAELDQPPAERHRSKLLVAVALYCSGIDSQVNYYRRIGATSQQRLLLSIAALLVERPRLVKNVRIPTGLRLFLSRSGHYWAEVGQASFSTPTRRMKS